MAIGKTIALTRRTFVGKVTSLLFNMLSRLVLTFLPRSKHLLISWLQSPSAVILEPRKIKSLTLFLLFPHLFPGLELNWGPLDFWSNALLTELFRLLVSLLGALYCARFLWCWWHLLVVQYAPPLLLSRDPPSRMITTMCFFHSLTVQARSNS